MRRIALLLIVLLAGCSMQYEGNRDMMDTFVTITVVSDDQDAAQEAIEAAFDEIARVESKFTIYEDSIISELNGKKSIETDEETLYVIDEGIMYSKMTEGAFDISVQPILDLYSSSFESKGRPPNASEIDEVLDYVDYRRINTSESRISIPADMKITLGGIAKGYAIDRAVEVLEKKGVEAGLVNIGGDLRGYGTKPDGSVWRVALRNPDDPNEHITVLEVDDEAVATSGNYERYFDKSREFHHIVDPNSGYSAQGLISATVKADTAIEADAIATGVFVMGREGLGFLQEEGMQGLLITEDREILETGSIGMS